MRTQLIDHCVILLLAFVAGSPPASGQSLSVRSDQDLNFDIVGRVMDGGYAVCRYLGPGEEIGRFDPQFQAVWTKQLVIDGDTGLVDVHTTVLHDGTTLVLRDGINALISGPAPGPDDDSIDVRLDLVRIDPVGSVAWARTLHFLRGTTGFDDIDPYEVSANDEGELVLTVHEGIGSGGHILIRIASDGTLRWVAEVSGQSSWTRVFIPEGSSDLYFTSGSGSAAGPLTIGKIDVNGTTSWVREVSIGANLLAGTLMRLGANGDLVVGGTQQGNTFLLSMNPSGSVNWLRLLATTPPTSPGVGITVNGLEAFDTEYVLLSSAGLPGRTVTAHVAPDGSLIAGHRTLTVTQGEIRRQVSIWGLDKLNNELTLAGNFNETNTTFGFSTNWPVIVTKGLADPDDCYFGVENFSVFPLPVADIQVLDGPEVPMLALPTVSVPAVTLFDVPSPASEPLCVVSGIAIQGTPDPDFTVYPNPVSIGEEIIVRTSSASNFRLADGSGRSVFTTTHPATMHRIRSHVLAAGYYILTQIDVTGNPISTRPVVVN
ncbi:MAG: T9SS type A sorting domain-containing protein [Flavobacteriales bacterium]|nr:T9SS type A sorting domain-containing protein [Flavobacteriales bacterium]